MFFDIIKNDDNTNLTTECKTANTEIEQKIKDIGVETNKFGDDSFNEIFSSEYVYRVIRSWMYDSFNKTGAQIDTVNLLFPSGVEDKDVKNFAKLAGILFPSNRTTRGQTPLWHFEFHTNTGTGVNMDGWHWRDTAHILLRSYGKQVDKYTNMLGFWSGNIPHELLDLIEDWYDDLYDIFLNNPLESIHKFLAQRSTGLNKRNFTSNYLYGVDDKEKLSEYKKNLFTKINKSLSSVVSSKDLIEQAIENIGGQVSKLNGLLEGLEKRGAKVEINRVDKADHDFGIEIQQGDYYFETNYVDVVQSIECPRLASKKTGGDVCIQPNRAHQGPGAALPVFDHIMTIFMILNTGQKNIVPILDYFVYFTDLGITVQLGAIGYNYTFRTNRAGLLNNTAIAKTMEHFNTEGMIGDVNILGMKGTNMEVGFYVDSRGLPPINRFINRFRIERNRLRKQPRFRHR